MTVNSGKLLFGLVFLTGILFTFQNCSSRMTSNMGRSSSPTDEANNSTDSTSPTEIVNPIPNPVPAISVSATFSSTSMNIPNPDRGFYGWSGSDFVSAYSNESVKASYDEGMRLVLCKIQLDSFRKSDLPSSFLFDLNNRFTSVRAAGMKCSLLFSYDFSDNGLDASASVIKRHLEQLKPVLATNADVIPYMRGGFIGAYGEWHSSQSGNSCGYHSVVDCPTADKNREIVRDALIANVPATTQIGIRYPSTLRDWYPSPTQQSRLGASNDCFMAGPSDSGTYTYPDPDAQRSYIKNLTANAAFGGETCDNAENPLRTSCADILSEGAQYHLAWLNSSYSTAHINSWKNNGCYEQVSSLIGYRMQLDAINHASSATPESTVSFNIDLRNVGWAKMYVARKIVVTLKHKTSDALINGSAGNMMQLPAQATASTRVAVSVTIPVGAAIGDYDVYLSLPDVFSTTASDARFSARFANADNLTKGQAFEASTARFKVGTVISIK